MATDGTVRRAIAGDETILRETRLAALTDAPQSFTSTYERELARTDEDWKQWIATSATFLLERAGTPVGMVVGKHGDDPTVVHLLAMWVDPAMRGSGGADALITAVLDWARSEDAGIVRLDVVLTNTRARRCYERHGFQLTGHQSTHPRDGQIDVRMERILP